MIFYCELTGTMKKFANGKWYTDINGKWVLDK